MSKKLNIMVIDDHPLFLEGLKLGLESIPGDQYAVTTETSTTQALRWFNHPRDVDLILCDLKMPETNGIEFIHTLFRRDIWIPMAIISASENPLDIENALNAGAAGFINKSSDRQELDRAIQTIMAGERYVPASYSDSSRLNAGTNLISMAEALGITPRQLEVLGLIELGISNKEISARLGVAESTIKSHTKALFQIFNVKNRTACVRSAMQQGLLPEQPFYRNETAAFRPTPGQSQK